MARPPTGKTTESTRRHAFMSFKDRIDAIRIVPNLDLATRAFDHVELSHFLTTLDHWKEINISGNFTDFLDKVEMYSQSLPQILHHKALIYTALHEHISVKDIYSIQPLLELLAQFVHDLGEDFMEYYTQTLNLLIDVALSTNPDDKQNSRNSSNQLQWVFNCLAFIFKYLVKPLTKDLLPTFQELAPLLKLNKKTYVSRFCVEALSYLVKKLKLDDLTSIIVYTFNDEITSNEAYCDSLATLYSEAAISTKGNFHSKAKLVLLKLLEISFLMSPSQVKVKTVSIIADILLDVVNHGSAESCAKYYELVIDFLVQEMEKTNDNLLPVSELLIAVSFAESGKRVTSWNSILTATKVLVDKILPLSDISIELQESVNYLLIILFRNCDNDILTRLHLFLFDSAKSIVSGEHFLSFADACLTNFGEKVINFGIGKAIQEYIYNITEESQLKKLALFVTRFNNHRKVTLPKLFIGYKLQSRLMTELDNFSIIENLHDVYWRLLLLINGGDENFDNNGALVSLLETLLSRNSNIESQLSHDIVSITLSSLTSTLNPIEAEKSLLSIYNLLVSNFATLQESSIFIESFIEFIKKFGNRLQASLRTGKDDLLNLIVKNLYLPAQESRINAIQLIIVIYQALDDEIPSFLSQIQIIEQMPRNFGTSRDIQLRVRNLAIELNSEAERLSSFDQTTIVNFTIGLLTNKFQPSWEVALEVLPNLLGKCSEELWRLCFKFLVYEYESQDNLYQHNLESFLETESNLIEWQPNNSKLKSNFVLLEEQSFSKYRNIDTHLTHNGINSRADNTYSSIMRSQALKALSAMPSLGERNSKSLLSLVFNKVSADDLDEDEKVSLDTTKLAQNWTLADRNSLLKLFSKFKNLKKIHESDRLYNHLLVLLSSKQLVAQKMALDVLLSWGIGSINKYRDNLKNLLDETLLKDEISKFITESSDSSIEESDLHVLMPLILRILFGRAQGTPKSNSKAGRKFAVLSVLPLLKDSDIVEFLKVGSTKIGLNTIKDSETEVADSSKLKRISGFVNLLTEVYTTLGPKHSAVLSTTLEPLLYALITSQSVIDTIDSSPESTIIDIKTARTIRLLGMKCLSDLFVTLGESYNWEESKSTIYESIIKPRLTNFANENLQQVSSLMRIMLNFIDHPNTLSFLYVDGFAPAKAIITLLSNTHIKVDVTMAVLEFSFKALNRKDVTDDEYYILLALLVNSLLTNLPTLIESIENKEVGSSAIKVLLKLIDGGYVSEQDTKKHLIKSLTAALDKPPSQIESKDKVNMLLSLSAIIDGYDCTFADISPLYQACSKALRMFAEPKIRDSIVLVFVTIGFKFEEVKPVADILTEINANSSKRMHEIDFERRLSGFKRVNEELYRTLTPIQWLPLIYAALFFINDEEELVIRSNSAYLLTRFIDSYSNQDNLDLAKPYIADLKQVVLPYLRIGLRKRNEEVRSEYIGVLGHIVEKSKFFEDFDDMKILSKADDDEMSFFVNITHIQLHRRQRAIRRLVDLRNELNENNISHYILPIIEHYALSDEEKYSGIAFESYEAISYLVRCLGWNHYKALMKRYISNLKAQKSELLKNYVKLLVACSKAFMVAFNSKVNLTAEDNIKKMPSDSGVIDDYILQEVFPPILKILVIRNDDTIVARTPLAEALSCFLSCLSEDKIERELPGVLTSTCQVMRSRSEELREAVRKSLSKIITLLGPKYLVFILRELKTALSRGSQIHVLSYTVHYLLAILKENLKHGELDEAAEIVVEIMMEDIFGAAGQEKDAEGYHSKMKEVKYKKSFDTGEILSANVNLGSFKHLLKPIKLLLQENLSLKIQNKVDELLRRFSMGLHLNEQSKDPSILSFCFEIVEQTKTTSAGNEGTKITNKDKQKDHFMVKLDKKSTKMHQNNMGYVHTLQKFAFEVLKTVTTKHDNLKTVERISAFVPLLDQGLDSESEGVIISCLKVLNSIIRLDFVGDEILMFKTCTRKSLSMIKDSPTTNSELCQAALRFLATVVRHKPEVHVKPSAISYILLRIQPDLEEPNKQGLAFNFVKSIISQHIMIPEIYDVIDRVAKIMVVNHAKEIRDMSRSVYYQFLMEYDQGRGRLEKQFKFLVSNLSYLTEEGRQSVMELLHQIISKSSIELVLKLASSIFVALANVVVTDDSARCKEMASTLIGKIFQKIGIENASSIEKYITAWLAQDRNLLLKRCGLSIYKIYVVEFGIGANTELDNTAHDNFEKLVSRAKNDESGDDVLWELLYSALSVFSSICNQIKDSIFLKRYELLWKGIVEVLLYPHAWIRLISSRLVYKLISKLDELPFSMSDYEIQTIAYRLLRQLSAPSITQELADQIVKNLVLLGMRWEEKKTLFQSKESIEENDESGHVYATDYLVAKTCSIIRVDNQNNNSFISKSAAIKLGAMIVQYLEVERVESVAEKFILALFNFTENRESELFNLAQESKQILENKLGITVYTEIYARVKSIVNARRLERKTKRSQLAVNAPDVAAKRKLRKHERSRDKRKHEKDENGYYNSKKRKNV